MTADESSRLPMDKSIWLLPYPHIWHKDRDGNDEDETATICLKQTMTGLGLQKLLFSGGLKMLQLMLSTNKPSKQTNKLINGSTFYIYSEQKQTL